VTSTAITPAEFPWFRYDGYTFSLGLTDGTSAWLSGHSASRYDPELSRIVVIGGMREQARTAYDKIAAILAAAGMGFGDVTRLVENVTTAGLDSYAEAAAVRAEVLGGHPAALVTVAVDSLLRRDALLEVEVSATRGGGRALAGAGQTGWHRDGGVEGGDGLLYLPTILPVDEEGRVVAPDDLVGQHAFCLDRVERILAGVGLAPGHVAKVVASYAGEQAEVDAIPSPAARLGPVATGRLHPRRLAVPGALVALDCVATREEPVEVAPSLAGGPGCGAVRAGRTVLLSHASAPPPRGGPPDVLGQARESYRRIGELLAAAGLGPEHLVKTIEYVGPGGLAGYRGVAQVRQELLRSPWPASTGAVVGGVGEAGALIAVEATAVAGRDLAH